MSAPESNEFGFILNWGSVEWALSGVVSSGVGVAIWVWGLGGRIDKLNNEIERLRESIERLELKSLKHETEMDLLAKAVDDKYLETSIAREQLKAELLAKIAALPNQGFIVEQLNQMTTRIDRTLEMRVRAKD